MSNTYYAVAVKSATVSWKAWFFGSIVPGSFITVDKPPLSIWLMGLSGRIFGFSSLTILLPQAICAVTSVGVLHATVKRVAGPGPALLAAGALAISPVSIAIGRVNNPDALLVFLLVLSTYLVVRAVQSGRTKMLVFAGVVVGLAFMTKMLQGWMVVPALGAVYLLAGAPRLATRIKQVALAGVAMTAVSAAWPLAVMLWPGLAPYIGGSTDGSARDLIFRYNGFGRLFGEGGGSGGASFGGTAGWLRMFNTQVGGQIAWLLPLAVVGLIGGLRLSRGKPRTDVAALRQPGLLGRRALAVTAVAAIIALGAGPASYAVATSGQALNGNNFTAGLTTFGGMGSFGGGMGGGGQNSASSEIIDHLLANQGSAKHLVAVSGSQAAAPIILVTGKPVVTMGGFTGSDNAPTVSQLEQMVSSGELQYVLINSGGGRGGPGGGGSSSEVTTWVQVGRITVSSPFLITEIPHVGKA